MSLPRLRTFMPLCAGIIGFTYFVYARDYPFRLALMMGAALMVLGFAALRTWERLRQMK